MTQHPGQTINSDKETKNEFSQLLFERFLHLAQKILCNNELAIFIARLSIDRVQLKYKKLPPEEPIDHWMKETFDEAVENYFQEIISRIKENSASAKQELANTLYRMFFKSANHHMGLIKKDDHCQEIQDIVQDALLTVIAKCTDAKPKYSFITWAQAILNNKCKEYYRKTKTEKKYLDKNETEYDPIPSKSFSRVSKTRSVKEVDPNEVKVQRFQKDDQSNKNDVEEDPYDYDPIQLLIGTDLKKRLLAIVTKMDERCRRVFKMLFTEKNTKFMYEEFPDLTRSQIDVIVSRCRKKLKEIALKGGILS